jgi:endonuclease/exonuclease/phosphatase family metal-dependent hydrolase
MTTWASRCRTRPAEEHDRTVRVATWSLRTDTAVDPPPWPDRLPEVAAVIGDLAPHVLGTQDASAHMLEELDAHLPSRYAWLGEGRLGARSDGFTAVFYDTARFNLLSWRTWWLSDRPRVPGSVGWGAAVPRTATTVRLRDAGDGTAYTFVNTHLDHESTPARVEGARMLVESLRKCPAIVVGDFSAAAGSSDTYTVMVGGGLVDAVEPHAPAGRGLGTFPNFGPAVAGAPRVDWVLTTPDLTSTDACVVDVTGRTVPPSDHLPVVADLVPAGVGDPLARRPA